MTDDADTVTTSPLTLDPAAMRDAAALTVELLVDLLTHVRDQPVLQRGTPPQMRDRLAGPPPEGPTPYAAVLEQLARDVLPFASRPDHPRYLAFVPTGGTWPGALGDLVASALSTYVGSWMEAAGPTQVELEVVGWFARWIGYPPTAAGVLVSGGSAANLTALACAREASVGAMRPDVVAYVSAQAHSSVARAARVLGFRPEQVRILPVDDQLRMRPDVLADAVAADREAGRRPLVVSASAGATNAGTVDPLADLADVCAELGTWFHVDAAYGGFAALTRRGRHLLRGIERADSVTLDPHKWLYQSYECGCLLVRDGRLLEEAFAIEPDYLRDAGAAGGEVNLCDRGLQLSRSARALKVWMSVRTFGVAAFREAIDRCMDAAVAADLAVRAEPELELLHGASLGVVCFRRRPPGIDDEAQLDELNRRLVAELDASGVALVSSTRLRNRYAVRLCVLNHTTTEDDVLAVVRWFADAPVERSSAPRVPPVGTRDADVGAVWPRPTLGRDRLSEVRLFDSVPPDLRRRLAREAWTAQVAAGAVVVRRFDAARELYVVVDGRLEVRGAGDELLRVLGPGDFFGEIAALDWGAGYSYPRLATVVAASPARLIVVAAATLRDVLAGSPELDRLVRDTAAERLAGL